MTYVKRSQNGFVLIIAMILMVVMSLFAVSGMRQAAMSEKIAGGYMDRNRAQQAAEQALLQGQTLLRANAVTCMETTCDNTNLVGLASAYNGSALPDTWSDANSVAVVLAAGQLTSAKYLINALTHADYAKTDCKPYSILGRGVGLNVSTVVLLQSIIYICPTD
jgi:type IV pilus assembly protein PilX